MNWKALFEACAICNPVSIVLKWFKDFSKGNTNASIQYKLANLTHCDCTYIITKPGDIDERRFEAHKRRTSKYFLSTTRFGPPFLSQCQLFTKIINIITQLIEEFIYLLTTFKIKASFLSLCLRQHSRVPYTILCSKLQSPSWLNIPLAFLLFTSCPPL